MLDDAKKKFVSGMMPLLSEKSKRLFLGSLANLWGRGSLQDLHELTGVAKSTIIKGKKQLTEQTKNPCDGSDDKPNTRQRKEGGGRKSIDKKYPLLRHYLMEIIDGSPMGNSHKILSWTTKSLRDLSEALELKGLKVSFRTLGTVLESMGFSLQKNSRQSEGEDFQFKHIEVLSLSHLSLNQPVIFVEVKKKKSIERREASSSESSAEDISDDINAASDKTRDIVPCEDFVNVGINKDNAEFTVSSIRSWWKTMGQRQYPEATRLMITVDGGRDKTSKNLLWRRALHDLSAETGLQIYVSQLPLGTFKWNKIEYSMFCTINQNLNGHTLETLQIGVNLVAAIQTLTQVKDTIDPHRSPSAKGFGASYKQEQKLKPSPKDMIGQWDYIISPYSQS